MNQEDDLFAELEADLERDNGDSRNDEEQAGVLEMNLVRNRCRDELDCYIKMPRQELRSKVTDEDGNEKVVFNNPLEWWKRNQKKISTLAGLARMYLAIQATSAPTERVFSVASRVISKFRTSLDPEMAGMLFYVAENFEWYEKEMEKPTVVE